MSYTISMHISNKITNKIEQQNTKGPTISFLCTMGCHDKPRISVHLFQFCSLIATVHRAIVWIWWHINMTMAIMYFQVPLFFVIWYHHSTDEKIRDLWGGQKDNNWHNYKAMLGNKDPQAVVHDQQSSHRHCMVINIHFTNRLNSSEKPRFTDL